MNYNSVKTSSRLKNPSIYFRQAEVQKNELCLARSLNYMVEKRRNLRFLEIISNTNGETIKEKCGERWTGLLPSVQPNGHLA